MIKNVFLVVEILVAVGLVSLILLQAKGTGLSSSFGGGGEFYQSRRGVEKIVTYATIGLTALFGIVSIVLLVMP